MHGYGRKIQHPSKTIVISVAIDWGSSSFRAYRFDSLGQHIDTRESSKGIKYIQNADFEGFLRKQTAGWFKPDDTVLLSGMISSRNGWLETDYLPCPAALDQLTEQAQTLNLADIKLIFLPGICQHDPADVMRGEELQLLGAADDHADGLFIIPGTHSKWAYVSGGVIERFRTIPTGEIFDLLINHSLIGALTQASSLNKQAFAKGVYQGFHQSTPISDFFTTRSSRLLQQQSAEESYAWLSGLLIGNEIREGLSMLDRLPNGLTLIGAEHLCRKYQLALHTLSMPHRIAEQSVTVQGYQKLIAHLST